MKKQSQNDSLVNLSSTYEKLKAEPYVILTYAHINQYFFNYTSSTKFQQL